MTLSHGQASVERGFSVNKAIITENISTDSIVGKHLVRDYLLTNNLKPHNVQFTSNLKAAFKSARQKSELALEAERSKKEKQAVEDQKAIILSEIEDVKFQITLLTKTSVMLEKEFVLCVEQAEKETDVSLVSKTNALKRKSEEKKEDVAKLEEALSLLKDKEKLN